MPAPYSAGSIFLQVVPSFRGVPEQIAREARDWGDQAGRNFDESFEKQATASSKKVGQRITKEMDQAGRDSAEAFGNRFISWSDRSKAKKFLQAFEDEAKDAGGRSADAYAGDFETRMKRAVDSLNKKLPTIRLGADDSDLQAKLRQAMRDVAVLSNAKAEIGMDLEPGARAIMLARVDEIIREIADKSATIDARVNAAGVHREIAAIAGELHALSAITIEPDLKVDKQLGAFERGIKNALDSALRDLGTVNNGVGSNAGERAVADLRQRMYDFSDLRIGIDVSSETARERLAQFRDELQQIQREHWSVDLDANTAAAEAHLASFVAALDAIDGRHVDVDVDVKDAVSMGTVLRGLEEHGVAAGQSMDQLSAATGRASSSSQDGANSFRAFNTRVLGVAALGPLVVPALGGIAGGIAALLPLAVAGGAGLGVLALGLVNVGAAYKALGASQAAASQDMATQNKAVDTAGRQVRDAEAALAQARTQAARAAEDSSKRITDAERAVGDARKQSAQANADAARQVQQALRGVSDAERNLADARQQAAQQNEDASRRVEQALRGVRDAERNYQDAVKASEQAQQDLTQARKDAADQLDELQLRVRDNALDQRQAVLDLHDAEQALAKARADGLKGDDLEKYQLAYERAKLRIDQTAESQQQLTEEQAKWAKTGIEGSDGVVKAQDRVASAQRGVLDAQQQVADANDAVAQAREAQTRAAEQGAARIADAERSLADANDAVARARETQVRTAEQGNERVASAERSLADARQEQARQQADSQRAVAQAQQAVTDALASYSDALGKTSASTAKLNEAMAKLSPTGQAFVRFLDDLKPKMRLFSQIAEEGFLPGLASWMDSIITVRGPQLQGIIGGVSDSLGNMFGRFATSIQGPAFSQLFDMMDRAAPRFLGYMGATLLNLGEGVASLSAALEPLGDIFGVWLIEASRRFRDWAANLSGSTGLQTFFEYVQRIGPKIGDFFWNLADALLAIAKSVAPFAEGLMGVLSQAFAWIAQLDPGTLANITLGIVGLTLGLQAIFGLTALAKSFESALHIVDDTLGRMGGRGGAIAAVGGQVGLFAGALTVLYTQSSLVRDTVNDVLGVFVQLGDWLVSHIAGFKSFVELLAVMAASWKGASLIGDWIGKAGTAAANAAPGFGVFAAKVAGSDTAGTNAMNTMGKFGKALGTLGNALPVIGIGFGVFAAGMEAVNRAADAKQQQLNDWVTATHQGGEKAQEAAGKLNEYRQKIADAEGALAGLEAQATTASGATEGFATGVDIAKMGVDRQREALNKANAEYDKWWRSLTPIEQAQTQLQEAQNNLTLAIQQHGEKSDEARAAAERYTTAQEAVQQIQYDVAAATSGLNQQLQTQLQIMQTIAQAEVGYEQAMSSLTDAHQRSKDALAQYGAKSKEYQDALLAEEQQELSTADAAQRAMEARYQNADATTRQAAGQAAYYLELERQKEMYGELPPRLEQMRLSLASTIDPTVLAAAKFYELGANIKAVPDSKTILLDSSTTDAAITKIEDLGLHVERLPDGTVKVTADSAAAQAVIDDILKPKTLEVTVSVQGDYTDAKGNIHVPGTNGGPGGRQVAGAATGGHIRGPGTGTSDSIPVYLSNGEYVVRAASVNKYGLGFLDAINRGDYGGSGYRDGGPIGPRIKSGRLAFAGGGLAANWGGTISLSGGDVSPLASMWATALGQIQALSGMAASSISGAFAGMRDTASAIFSDTTGTVMGKWVPFLGALQGTASQAAGGVNGIFGQLRDWVLGRSAETRDGGNSIFGQMRDLLFGRASETRDNSNSLFSQMRDLLFGRASETRDNSNSLFSQMRDLIFGRTSETRDNSNNIFSQMRDLLFGRSSETRDNSNNIFSQMRDLIFGRTSETRDNSNNIFSQLRDQLFGRASETRDNSNNLFGQLRDLLFGRSDETRDGVNGRIGQMRDGTTNTVQDAVNRMFGSWGTLPGGLLGPVNTIIDKVLNNGLFKAFNAIVGALGLDAKLNIPTVDVARLATGGPVRGAWTPQLAAGGKVPGWSPHDKADNIPAWLTAGEYVHPVDSVQYYGPEFMEAIRKKRIPREAIQRYASGGWVAMQNAVKQQFPWARITSAFRSGDPGYHGKGLAIDVGGAVPYPGAGSREQMLQINRWIADTFKNITELIHTDTGAINLWHGQPHTYNAATQAEHRNHVHWAQEGNLDGSGGLLATLGKLFGVAVDAISDPAAFLKDTVGKALEGFGGTPVKEIMAAGARKAVDWAVDKVTGFLGSVFGSGDSGNVGPGSGPVVDQVRAVMSQFGWDKGPQWDALSWIIQKESGWNPNAQNPSSTAYGLFQLLNGTWGSTGVAKSSNPGQQALAGARYIQGRYGNPVGAKAFWQSHGWYSEGGPVQPADSATGAIVPDLHDTGGWLMPGLNVIMNRTGRPEPTINPQTLDALQSIAATGGSGGAAIGTLVQNLYDGPTARQVAGAVDHAATVARRGGKY